MSPMHILHELKILMEEANKEVDLPSVETYSTMSKDELGNQLPLIGKRIQETEEKLKSAISAADGDKIEELNALILDLKSRIKIVAGLLRGAPANEGYYPDVFIKSIDKHIKPGGFNASVFDSKTRKMVKRKLLVTKSAITAVKGEIDRLLVQKVELPATDETTGETGILTVEFDPDEELTLDFEPD